MKYKDYPSKYELYNIIWVGIEYDKSKLIRLLKRIRKLKFLFFIKRYREELSILEDILKSYDSEKLKNLLLNDEQTSRMAIIEKWSKIGAIEILTNDRFTKETYDVISNLPLRDYQIVTKRIEELINVARNVTTQLDVKMNEIPGL